MLPYHTIPYHTILTPSRRAVEELIDERRRRHEYEKEAERKQRENESVCIVLHQGVLYYGLYCIHLHPWLNSKYFECSMPASSLWMKASSATSNDALCRPSH